MSPLISTELAAEHRADLLRAAEAHRRAAAARAHRRTLLSRVGDHVADLAGNLAVRLRRRRPISARPTATLCCA